MSIGRGIIIFLPTDLYILFDSMVDKDVIKHCRKFEQNLMSHFRDIYQESVTFGGKIGTFR